jgi:lipoate-protein ligase A
VKARLLIDQSTAGIRNMAIDDALLQDAAENGTATLRFYGWDEPTLSLGYFQRYADRQLHAASRHCALVRRQTGGGAILHDLELTYSLTLPPSHQLATQNERLYYAVHEEFIAALSSLASRSTPPWKLATRDECDQCGPDGQPFLCFLRQSPGDVILTTAGKPASDVRSASANPQPQTWKILGSAQRRYRGAILQHGSLLLERSPAAPELPGLSDLIDLTVSAADVAQAVRSRLAVSIRLQLFAAALPPELESKAAELANNKYGSPAWTNRR